MSSRWSLTKATAWARAGLIMVCVLANPLARDVPAADEKAPPGEDAFRSDKVLTFQIEIPAEEYQALQPPLGMGFTGGANGTLPSAAARRRASREGERNLFGIEFPWVRGRLLAEGKGYDAVRIRYAGNASYMASAGGLKRPFKIDLGHFEHREFQGHGTINLQSGTLDPTGGRESFAFAVFREAGVPAPRTAFVELTLTVPGKYDTSYLGLYTLVEPIDQRFLADRFRTDKGLLMKPERLRGIDDLGDDWAKYKGPYQPQSEPTPEQSRRLIEFAGLIQKADDARFQKEIGSYLDVEEFLRFMAVNALLANADNFLTLGYNYFLYLHPETNQFVFIPGEQEMALANFPMMGSPDQLMDMSLDQPYSGPNRLVDRLLAIKEMGERYRRIVKELAATCFKKDRLLAEAIRIDATTKDLLAKETAARTARAEPAGGFGFGPPPGGAAPRPIDLRTFVEERTASVAAQLEGKRAGYVPKFSFGPAPGGPPRQVTVDDRTIHDLVKAPDGFRVTLYAAPPRVGYPVAVSASAGGELFVAVDEQGSLGRNPGGGKVLRCVDKDGDGKADQIDVFARMEHPRGVIYQDGSAWVLHPPLLSVYHDDDGNGVSDRHEVLVTGLTTDMIDKRGGDHTTNGIRMGIDGWIYIAVGDYGFHGARAKDGTALSQRGGGIVRVRPDGTELEIYATGLRNPFAIGIDPYLNLFTRDNTNDGAGWDVRVSHIVQTAHYGYPQLYANFPDEIMPTLGQFGQGGGTGVLVLQDPRWPAPYRETLLTGDWGRSEVYRHDLRGDGPTFDLKQDVFLKIPRPTGMDIDAGGRLYVASWRGGEASVNVGPNVGFLACITPIGLKPEPVPNPAEADLKQLIGQLAGPIAVSRLRAQRELLKRGRKAESTHALLELAADSKAPPYGRVAAIFTLNQLDGKECRDALLKLMKDAAVREFAMRALTDRRRELAGLDIRPFLAALGDESPRVRAQAIISLVRLNDPSAARSILPLTDRPKGTAMPTRAPVHGQPDPDRVLSHLATRALVSLGGVETCLEALDGPHQQGALRALREMHDKRAVEGLIKKLGTARTTELRREILVTLIRLYNREADYEGTWWGIRPDSTGPYYDPQEWAMSDRIGSVLAGAVLDGDAQTSAFLRAELARHQVDLKGLPSDPGGPSRPRAEEQTRVVILKADPRNPDQIGNMPYEVVARRTLRARGDAQRGKALFTSQSCRTCHTDADGQTPKGPHLVDIGKRSLAEELVESILRPSAKIAQGYETYAIATNDGRLHTGFVVTEGARTVVIREATGASVELKRETIDDRRRQEPSVMPEGVAGNLTPEQLADLIAYLQSLK